jgi:4-hydroxy-tetrahydrodipicolinate synthase
MTAGAGVPRLWTAMATPFTEAGALDDKGCAHLAQWLVQHGTEALVVAGSTGEAPTLSEQERGRLFAAVRDAVPDGVPVYCGTGSNDTRATVALSRAAAGWGADGLLVVAPYYNKPTQAGLRAHFLQVAGAVDIPIIVYNVPGRTAVTLAPALTAQIMEEAPHVLAVKEATGNLDTYSELLARVPAGRLVLSGDDSLTLPALAIGAHGIVSVAAHLVGDSMQAMIQAHLAGDVTTAAHLHRRLYPVFRELFREPNPVPLKWALARMGIAIGPPRLPLVPARDENMLPLAAALDAARSPVP